MSRSVQNKSSGKPKPRKLALTPAESDLLSRQELEGAEFIDPPVVVFSQDDGNITKRASIMPDERTYLEEDRSAAQSLAWARLKKTTGIRGVAAAQLVTGQITSMGLQWSKDVQPLVINGTLGLINEIGPRDAAEGMLATQMAATHNQIMRLHTLTADPQLRVDTFQMYLSLIAKLERTYTAQLEALARYRNQGKQKVTVIHKHIDQRNQGVIVSADKAQVNIPGIPEGAGGEIVMEGQPDATDDTGTIKRIAEGAEMPCSVEANRAAVQSSGS